MIWNEGGRYVGADADYVGFGAFDPFSWISATSAIVQAFNADIEFVLNINRTYTRTMNINRSVGTDAIINRSVTMNLDLSGD